MHVNKLLQYGVLSFFVGAASIAQADTATTSGGIKIKTDDGKFEFGIGGRLQLDTVIYDDDKLADLGLGANGQPLAMGASSGTTSGTYFRRAYLTLTGKLYDFKFKFENDFANGASPGSFRDVFISHGLFGGDIIVGQRKPFRGLEELTSSNEILLMERPFTTNVLFASGGNRQYQPGAFYLRPFETPFGFFLAQASIYNANHAIGQAPGQGFGTAERLTWLIVSTDTLKVHIGAWGGEDEFSKSASGSQGVNYAGRNSSSSQVIGPSQFIAPSILGSRETFYGGEAAAAWGSAFVQSEWSRATYEDSRGVGSDDSLVTWYVQGSYFLTGEKKAYKKDRGTFGSPKVNHPWGAVEVVGRFDSVHNTDRSAVAFRPAVLANPTATPPVAAVAASSGVCEAAATAVELGAACKATQFTVGMNYYFNPAVRVMFNYVNGTNKVTDDNTASYNLRLQLAF